MKLIDEAKHWYKMFSLQANAMNVAFLGTWSMLPEKFQNILPIPAVVGIAVSLLVLGTIGRLVKQDSISQ